MGDDVKPAQVDETKKLSTDESGAAAADEKTVENEGDEAQEDAPEE